MVTLWVVKLEADQFKINSYRKITALPVSLKEMADDIDVTYLLSGSTRGFLFIMMIGNCKSRQRKY